MDPAELEFTVTWIGFWFNIPGFTLDPTEVANNFFDTGVDVILSGIDTTEGIDVTGQRADGGEAVWSVPYDFENACDSKPEICLGVPYFNWGPAYLSTASAVKEGTWMQSWDWDAPYWADLTDNSKTAVGWVSGPGLSADAQTNLELFIVGLAGDTINVW
ncbi:MAG: BMP family ABC transporter substrate-binding protein, partial [Chloroflexi bacterium]|nr:BMP family ABC transporter substrate-binding protein [Chloroflexota bacterium]